MIKDELRRYVAFIEYGVEKGLLKSEDLERVMTSALPTNPLAHEIRGSKNASLKSGLSVAAAKIKPEDWKFAVKAVAEIHTRITANAATAETAKDATTPIFRPQMIWTSGEIDGNPQGSQVHWQTLPDGHDVVIVVDSNGKEIKIVDPYDKRSFERRTIYSDAVPTKATGGTSVLARANGDFLVAVGGQGTSTIYIHSLLTNSTIANELSAKFNSFYLHEMRDGRVFLIVTNSHWFSVHEVSGGKVLAGKRIECSPQYAHFKVYNDEQGELTVFMIDSLPTRLKTYHPLVSNRPILNWTYPGVDTPELILDVSPKGTLMFAGFLGWVKRKDRVYVYTTGMAEPEMHSASVNASLSASNLGTFHQTDDGRTLLALRSALVEGEKEKTLLIEVGSDKPWRVVSDLTPIYLQFLNFHGADRLVVTHDDLKTDLLDLDSGKPLFVSPVHGRPTVFSPVMLTDDEPVFLGMNDAGELTATLLSSGFPHPIGPQISNMLLGRWFRRKNGELVIAGSANHVTKEVISVYDIGKSKPD